MRYSLFLLLIIMLPLAPAADAGWFGADFSAEAVQIRPGQPPMSSRMHVSKGRLRTEFEKEGRLLVEILDPTAQRGWLLFPAQRSYMERKLPPGQVSAGANPDPCHQLTAKQAQCSALGSETIDGRATQKWRISTSRGERIEWIDEQRHFPVRQEQNGKLSFERRYLGEDEVSGRACEKWEMRMTTANGETVSSLQWYDPELNIALRQELAGGFIRELRGLQLAPQDASLFAVPEGYQRIQPPSLATPPGR